MSKQLRVVPKQGIVLQPERNMRRMDEAGATVPDNNYYRRLLKYGDIAEVTEKSAKVSTPEAAPIVSAAISKTADLTVKTPEKTVEKPADKPKSKS